MPDADWLLDDNDSRQASTVVQSNKTSSLDSLFPPPKPNSLPDLKVVSQKSLSPDEDPLGQTTDSFDKLWRFSVAKQDGDDDDSGTYIEDSKPKSDSALFKSKFANYDEQAYDSERQIKSVSDQVSLLEAQLDAKNTDLEEAERELRAIRENNESVLQKSESQVQRLNNLIADLQEALDDRSEQVETLQRQLDVAYKENNEEMYATELELKNVREKLATLQETLDGKEAEVKMLREKLARANPNYESEERTENDLKDFREQVAALQDALDEKETQAHQMQSRVDEAECENKILMEELDQLLKEKNEAESMTMAEGPDGNAANMKRIKELEGELEDASKVANLQLEELDEQVDALREKLKVERDQSLAAIKSRDVTIDELTFKLRKYEAVPVSSAESIMTEHETLASGMTSFAGASYGLTANMAETPAINTDDVTDIESAKQKVYEARADATSVRESLEISTKRCAELTLQNEALVKKNANLVDTTRERDELKDSVRDWTAQTYQWKRRAEDAEEKLAKLNGEDDDKLNNDSDHQGMMIKAAMENRSKHSVAEPEKKSGWSLFGRPAASNHSTHNHSAFGGDSDDEDDGEAKNAQIEALTETIAKLRSEMFQMTTSHKEETYLAKKRIAQLEGENEALTVQNGTLEQLNRFHES